MAIPKGGSLGKPICPVCKKKPLNEHSFQEQQKCVAKAKEEGIPI